MTRKVRIEDVAKAAGVSTQTVSRVINNRPDVLPQTRQKVLDVMKSLGYQPSLFARGLAGKKSHIIGMIAEDLSEPMMAHCIAAVELEARKHGYFLLVSSISEPADGTPIHTRMLDASHVDGLLFSRLGQGKQERAYLEQLLTVNVPRVALGSWPDAREMISSVELAESDGGCQAARYLLNLGHRKIGMITGPLANSAARDRSAGFAEALKEYGVFSEPTWVIEGDWTYQSGFAAARRLLTQAPEITAVFCQNDRMAIAAIQAFQQSGKQVPGNISVIGFDDIPDAVYMNPALTTMHQSPEEIGREAARLLFDAIQKPKAKPQHVQVSADLVERASCRAV